MKYCLNAESWLYMLRYDNSNSWIECGDVKRISTNDKIFTLAQDVLNELQPNLSINFNGTELHVSSDLGSDFDDQTYLSYNVYGFFDVYPDPPVLEQLQGLLANANDSVNNILQLNTDGVFYLNVANPTIIRPDCVVRFSSFIAGNGYVGKNIQNNEFESYTQSIFRIALSSWIKFLKNKQLDIFEDVDWSNLDQSEVLMDLYKVLWEIKANWLSTYKGF